MDAKSACIRCKKNLTRLSASKCRCFKFKPSSSGGAPPLQTRRGRDDVNSGEKMSLQPPSPPIEPLLSATSDGRPKKRALLCGVSYKSWKHRLHGPVNDVLNMQNFLIEQFSYSKQNIRILTEEEADPDRIPTKKNIESSLKWLVEGCEGGDSLVFYFSGHGLRQPDFAMDELDGFDETICPVDFLKEGMISDNEINATIVWPLKEGVTLHAIVDACHSGTILDLANVYDQKRDKWIDNRPPSGARKGTSGGMAICLSACGDDQLAADTSVLTGKTMNGAMTFILIHLIKNCEGISLTYGNLLECMHDAIHKVNQRGCIPYVFFKKLFRYKQIQEPLLSSSERFDVNTKKFTL